MNRTIDVSMRGKNSKTAAKKATKYRYVFDMKKEKVRAANKSRNKLSEYAPEIQLPVMISRTFMLRLAIAFIRYLETTNV